MTAGPEDLDMLADLGMDITRRIRAAGNDLHLERGSLVLLSRLRRRLIRSARHVPDEVDALLGEAIEADVISGMEF